MSDSDFNHRVTTLRNSMGARLKKLRTSWETSSLTVIKYILEDIQEEIKDLQDQAGYEPPIELKPCPYCGSSDIEIREAPADPLLKQGRERPDEAYCRSCASRGPYLHDSRVEAADYWNRRTKTPKP